MQNHIYRGVRYNASSSPVKKISNSLNFVYRGILYTQLFVNKKFNKNINLIYRGNFYNKFIGL